MRIGLFTELYPPSIGGQEIRFQQLAHALHEQGHDVSVFTIDHLGNLPEIEYDGGITIHRHPHATHYVRPKKLIRRSPKTILSYSAWCRKSAKRNAFDLKLYNQWPLLHILFSIFTPGKTVIDWCELRSGFFWSLIQTLLPQLGDANIAVSNRVATEIQRHTRNITFCLPSGLRVAEYKNLPKHCRNGLLYIGRISEHKNLPLLVRAFEALQKHGYTGRLTIAGSGPEAPLVSKLCESSTARNKIDFLGHVTDEDKIALLGNAEFLVITSQREGFPRVAAEAIASGTPIITAEYPDNGTVSIVNEYQCGAVAPPDPDAIAKTILSSQKQWSLLSTAATKRANELDWRNLVAQFESATQGIHP